MAGGKVTSLILLMTLLGDVISHVFPVPHHVRDTESSYWQDLGRREIEEALKKRVIVNTTRNIILFLGDGLGITASVAGRIYKGQKAGASGEEGYLSWERFPNVALLKTYNVDRQVPDSAATATAYLTGVKGNYYTIGVNGQVKENDCRASLDKSTWTPSILAWAQDAGKETGIITNTRITHATPSAAYAHSPQRKWECDSKIPEEVKIMGCKDIARQLVEDEPGKNIKVLLGGGLKQFGAPEEGPRDPSDTSCSRNDSRNLVNQWIMDKKNRGKSHTFIRNFAEFMDASIIDKEFILGLFSGSHMPYETFRKSPADFPSLKDMTLRAIQRLSKSKDGYFLLVEGGRIDHGLHDSNPRLALDEIIAFDEAIEATMRAIDVEDTLVLVTADHSHVMTINGYPVRGNDILGQTTDDYVLDKMPYTTLMFTNGFGANFTWNGTKVLRANVTLMDTRSPYFVAQSAVPIEQGYETHGGEDVSIYAIGPMAHLFHRLHEQSYVAHVMAYAACIGPYSSCNRSSDIATSPFVSETSAESGASSVHISICGWILGILVAVTTYASALY